PKGDFSVAVPAAPQEIEAKAPGAAGAPTLSVFLSRDPKTQLAYTLNTYDLPPAEQNQTLDKNLASFRAGLLSQLPGGKISKEAKVEVDGQPGREFQIELTTPVGQV